MVICFSLTTEDMNAIEKVLKSEKKLGNSKSNKSSALRLLIKKGFERYQNEPHAPTAKQPVKRSRKPGRSTPDGAADNAI